MRQSIYYDAVNTCIKGSFFTLIFAVLLQLIASTVDVSWRRVWGRRRSVIQYDVAKNGSRVISGKAKNRYSSCLK